MASPEERIVEIGLSLPAAPKPAGSYQPCVRSGTLLFISGMLPKKGDKIVTGRVGADISMEEAQEAARLALLSALSVIKAEIGNLEKIKKIVRLTGYVSSSEGFSDQHKVIDGASGLLASIFGEIGGHSRVSVGVSGLPLNAALEIELIVEVC